MGGGLELARELADRGKQVFLDMKLLDIGNTVERATRSAAATGATFLTVHGHDSKTLQAAVAGKSGTGLRILAVTVLTNLDEADLAEQGLAATPAELVARRAQLAHAAGCDGVVASGLEAAQVREVVGPGVAIVTPGVRLASDAAGDQARVATPQTAIAAGADYVVVGRPIVQAPDPRRSRRDLRAGHRGSARHALPGSARLAGAERPAGQVRPTTQTSRIHSTYAGTEPKGSDNKARVLPSQRTGPISTTRTFVLSPTRTKVLFSW